MNVKYAVCLAIATTLAELAGCVPSTDQPVAAPTKKAPSRALSHLEPGQKCVAWNELDVWVFRADRQKWTVDELATQLPIIKTGMELEVVDDAGDVGEWKGEWRLIRVRARGLNVKRLDLRDGRFAPDEYVDHEFCVQRRDMRVQ